MFTSRPHLWVLVPQSTVFPGTSMSSQVHLKRRFCEPPWVLIGCKVPTIWTQTIQNHQHLIFCKLKSLYLGYLMFRNPLRSPQLKLNVSIIFHNISLFLQSCFNQKSLKSNPGPKNRKKAPKSHQHITVWNRTSLQPLIARFAHPDQWRLPYLHIKHGNHGEPRFQALAIKKCLCLSCPGTPWIHAISNILFSGVQNNILKASHWATKHRKQTHKFTYLDLYTWIYRSEVIPNLFSVCCLTYFSLRKNSPRIGRIGISKVMCKPNTLTISVQNHGAVMRCVKPHHDELGTVFEIFEAAVGQNHANIVR